MRTFSKKRTVVQPQGVDPFVSPTKEVSHMASRSAAARVANALQGDGEDAQVQRRMSKEPNMDEIDDFVSPKKVAASSAKKKGAKIGVESPYVP
jgi:hypothetical protein